MTAARALGTKVTMLVTPGVPDQSRDVTRRNYIKGLREAVKIANDAGITLTLENFPGATSPFVTADDFLEAAAAAPGLKLTYDNGNAFSGEDPARSFERCAAHVVHSHFKDWKEVPDGKGLKMLNGKSYCGALIGEGCVPQASCLRAMKSAGYAGYINIEYENNDYSADDAMRKATAWLRARIAEP
jgi:sugar phosphate isomerase/epimerase